MPDPSAFLAAWGLQKGLRPTSSLTVTNLRIRHIVIERYRTYAFPLVLDVQSSTATSASAVMRALRRHVASPHVVRSRYGNPYLCGLSLQTVRRIPTRDGVVFYRITGQGLARRVHPERSSTQQRKRKEAVHQRVGKGLKRLYSRFSTHGGGGFTRR